MIKIKKIVPYLAVVLLFFGCKNNQEGEQLSPSFDFQYPDHFPQPTSENLIKVNASTIDLGRLLFDDPILSKDSSISCRTCHLLEFGLSDNVALSNKGVSGKTLHRNSPTIFNMAWVEDYFWDGGSVNLERLMLAPITHPDEMGSTDIPKLVEHINNSITYRELAKEAFNIESMEYNHISTSLKAFVLTLQSSNTKYDNYLNGSYVLSSTEERGLSLFDKNCSSCHTPPLFFDNDYHNNGIDSLLPFTTDIEAPELGRFRISYQEEDISAYKTPSLRNLSFTKPYMHDGRFNSIDQVIEHYSTGIYKTKTVSSKLPVGGFKFTNKEKIDLKNFLLLLNDESNI